MSRDFGYKVGKAVPALKTENLLIFSVLPATVTNPMILRKTLSLFV